MTNLIDILRAQPVWKTTPSAKILFQELFAKANHMGDVVIESVKEFQESTGLNANHYYTALKVLLAGSHITKVKDGHFRIPSYKLIETLLERKAPSVVASSKPPEQQNHMGTNQLPAAQAKRPSRPFNPISEVGHVEGNFAQRDDGETLYGERGEVIAQRGPGQHLPARKPSPPVEKTVKQIIRKPVRHVTIRKPDMTTLR